MDSLATMRIYVRVVVDLPKKAIPDLLDPRQP